MEKRIWINRALVVFAVVVIALLAFAVQHFGVYDVGGLFTAPAEQEWDHIAAGNRIEKATGLDVLHIGPIGLRPPRKLVVGIVTSVLSERFPGKAIGEDTHLYYGGLEASEEDVKWIGANVGMTLMKMRYGGSLPRRRMEITYSDDYTEEVVTIGKALTVGELVDFIVDDNFQQSLGLLGATPRFHVSFVYKGFASEDDDGTAVAITGYDSNGKPVYEILENGEYVWEEEGALKEDPRTQWTFWTAEKWRWYLEHGGLFPPGKYTPAKLAVMYLDNYLVVRDAMTPLLNAIISEAFHYEDVTGERFWRIIEIDYLMLAPAQVGLGVDASGKPGFVAYRETVLIGTRFVFRARRPPAECMDGRYTREKRFLYLDRIWGEGRELTTGEVMDMLFHQKGSLWQPGQTFFGPLPYLYGYNHPWRADDMPT